MIVVEPEDQGTIVVHYTNREDVEIRLKNGKISCQLPRNPTSDQFYAMCELVDHFNEYILMKGDKD